MSGIGSHQSAKALRDEWLTPPWLLRALGPFDLDPCAPVNRPWPIARRHYTRIDNGLSRDWAGRVWCNPPYGRATGDWLARCAAHGDAAAQTMAPSERALPLIEEWLNEHSQQISTERMQADIPIARFSHRTGQLFLHRTALFAKVSEERIPRAAVKAALGDCYVTEKRARLSTHLPPVWVVVVKAAPLGWLPSSLGQENDDGDENG